LDVLIREWRESENELNSLSIFRRVLRMKLERLTKIDLQREAVQNSAARRAGGSFEARARIATRDARAHSMLAGILPGHAVHIASMGELSLHDVAAWAASEEAIKRIIALRNGGQVRRLEALVDSRMPTDCPDAHALMSIAFDQYAAGQNHSKVMAFTGGPARIVCISGIEGVEGTVQEYDRIRAAIWEAAAHA
jgi:hypothetical protein